MKYYQAIVVAAALAATGASPTSRAQGGETHRLEAAITQGTVLVDARLRFEDAEQLNPQNDAQALTARLRLGYLTGAWHGFDAFAEYEGVYAIGGDDRFNSGPPFLEETNNNTAFSTIADPTGDQVNRAWLRYSGIPDTSVKAGRQRLIFDNARFIGNVGWRQDEQTFDAATVVNRSLPGVKFTYSYLRRNNFIFFNENKLDGHLLNLNWAAAKALNLTAYGYFIDFREENALRAPGTPDHRIAGLRATGRLNLLEYALEYADQSDYADAPEMVDAEHYLAELGLNLGGINPKIGYEILGGDGDFGFSAPFGTNHAFQGWADVFLNTPANGIRDAYVSLAGKTGKFKLAAIYHEFKSDADNLDYGSEINLLIARPVTERLSLLLKYADYEADEFAVNTRRYWLQAQYSF